MRLHFRSLQHRLAFHEFLIFIPFDLDQILLLTHRLNLLSPDYQLEESAMQQGDRGIAMNVGKTVLVLVGFMLVIIAISNIIA